jgi:hypothetical protein
VQSFELNDPVQLRDELALGRRKLSTVFGSSPPRLIEAGELLAGAASSNRIYHLRAGWACQIRDLANSRRAILDVYLPGDVIGIDTAVRTRPLETDPNAHSKCGRAGDLLDGPASLDRPKHSVMILDLERLAIFAQKRAAARSCVIGTERGSNKAAN